MGSRRSEYFLWNSRNCFLHVDNRQDQTVMDRNVAVLVSACFFRVGICHIQSFNAGDQR